MAKCLKKNSRKSRIKISTSETTHRLWKLRKKKYLKPWMQNTDMIILTQAQRDSLDIYFGSHSMKCSKRNLKVIADSLQIPYKKCLLYVTKNYVDVLEDADSNDYCIRELNKIDKYLEYVWDYYVKYSRYFYKAYRN